MAEFPKFKYHSDQIGTEAFKKAEHVYEAPSFRRKMRSVFARTA